MKRTISLLLVAAVLLSCMLICAPTASASTKAGESRAISIVFDNSGSMYSGNKEAWCRATYAMEVFASMLNSGDILQIYPMWEITVGGQSYTMQNPLQIKSASDAKKIREIFTPSAGGTPIESIDYASDGLKTIQADKKYLIILTDGDKFHVNGISRSKSETIKELDRRVQALAGNGMSVMYLGIGSDACLPSVKESEYFVKKKASNTADVLSMLTEMCNLVFGRDTLPKNRISGKTVEFDISMSKLIIFVQGENISNVKLNGGTGKLISSQQTKYSTLGAGDYKSKPDTSLQGMIVTYEDCPAGTYTIEYSGSATSVEIYYEPDADLDFVFTDANGNNVDPNALYEGDYKVSFGMKDAQTGQLISSDLLGNPRYQGSYSVNGEKVAITHSGYNGNVPISLKMNDTFDANLTVTYLSGYTISKDSTDFGWPSLGIQVAARPAGDFKLEISGGEELYSLQNLKDGAPYIAKIYYQGNLLTGNDLKSVELKWEPDTSNALITKEFADDHYKLWLNYKNPDAPQDTVCGKCTVTIYAFYSAQGSSQAQTQSPLSYNIKDDFSPLRISLSVPKTYLVIKEMADSEGITVNLKMNGAMLTAEEFARVQMQVDCGGIKHTVTPLPEDSAYLIKFQNNDGIAEGKYPIKVTAAYTDQIGRETQVRASVTLTLSNTPLWLKWTIALLALLILFILIWIILHIRVLPKYIKTTKKLSNMTFDGETVTQSTNFIADIKKKSVKVQAKYGGKTFGLAMDVVPGKESYLYKSQKRRSAEVKVPTVKRFGQGKVNEAMIGSVKYVADENTGKLVPAMPNQKPFLLKNGMMVKYSGTIQDGGMDKSFEVMSKLNFKKK